MQILSMGVIPLKYSEKVIPYVFINGVEMGDLFYQFPSLPISSLNMMSTTGTSRPIHFRFCMFFFFFFSRFSQAIP